MLNNREQKINEDPIGIAGSTAPLKALSNYELLSRTKSLVQKERETHIQALRHLREIESRKLYFSQGFSSLFDYAVRELGYSEGAAFRRIKAMRLCRDLPEAEEKLQSGKLSLSSASQLQNFFEKQKKAGLKKRVLPEKSQGLCLEPEEPPQGEKFRPLENSAYSEGSDRGKENRACSKGLDQSKENRACSKGLDRSKESLGTGSLGSISQTGFILKETGKEKEQSASEVGLLAGKQIDFSPHRATNFRRDPGLVRDPELSFNKESETALSNSQKLDLIEKAEGRSSRETEKLLSENGAVAGREKARPLGKGRVEIKAIVSENCHKKLEELKNLLSHRNPSMSYGGLLDILSDLALDKYDPRRKGKRKKGVKGNSAHSSVGNRKRKGGDMAPDESSNGRNESCPIARVAERGEETSGSKSISRTSATSTPKSRQTHSVFAVPPLKRSQTAQMPGASTPKSRQTHSVSPLKRGQTAQNPGTSTPKLRRHSIPAEVKRLIWVRDKGCCSYVNPRTGRKCGSRRFLHIDHILPFALGGGAEADNLRLLCAGHNQFRARQTF